MKVVFVRTEELAARLQPLVRPDVEVCYLGQEVDSKNITDVLVLTSVAGFDSALLESIRASVADKQIDGASLVVAFF